MTTAAAQKVAQVLAMEAQKATTNIMEIHNSTTGSNTSIDRKKNRKNHKKKIKAHLRHIKENSKAALSALDDAIHNDDNADNNTHDNGVDSNHNSTIKIRDTLQNLRSATEELQEIIRTAQLDNKNMMMLNATPNDTCGGISINGARREGIYDITLKGPNGRPNRPYLTISASHLCKLIHLWTLQKQTQQDSDMTKIQNNTELRKENDDVNKDPIKFLDTMSDEDQCQIRMAIYCCLSRYEALRGAGYQCAVPGNAFQAAATKCGLGFTIECFASPLNCRYRNYCSAFPDIETAFGSIGSFFDDVAFNPTHGSFEANPPFVPETMFAMGQKIQRLLDDPERGSLSFLVIIPAWGGGIESDDCNYNNFCNVLEQSCHTRAKARISAADHAFLDGAQHTRKTEAKRQQQKDQSSLLRPSSWDTAVILMQNDAGKKKWPVDEKILKESFCGAFRDAAKEIPGSTNSIQKWEDRGVATGGSTRQKHHHRHKQESYESTPVNNSKERKRHSNNDHNSSLGSKQRKAKVSF
uniref:PCIF1 WW domain-containing protein n=1 Tax=Eucampia antarctica TaxID=49252 RepID=A0A7S2WQ80_9STRA